MAGLAGGSRRLLIQYGSSAALALLPCSSRGEPCSACAQHHSRLGDWPVADNQLDVAGCLQVPPTAQQWLLTPRAKTSQAALWHLPWCSAWMPAAAPAAPAPSPFCSRAFATPPGSPSDSQQCKLFNLTSRNTVWLLDICQWIPKHRQVVPPASPCVCYQSPAAKSRQGQGQGPCITVMAADHEGVLVPNRSIWSLRLLLQTGHAAPCSSVRPAQWLLTA